MNPLKIKASATPITSSNFQGLQTMTDTEIKNYIANVITTKFATDTNGSGTAELNVDTANALSGTSIGTFSDTDRTEATGTHPATGGITTTTYYAKQVTAAASESITNRPVGYGTGMEELTDAEVRTDVLDKVITAMVTESSYTAGQYKLSASAPAGGTWTSRYTITDVANGGNTTTYLWQKTAATSSANSDLRPLKVFSGNNVKQMSDAEIQQMLPHFRNRIISTGIGTYSLQATAPVSGTWVQMGDAFSDTREQVVSQNYTGYYTGSYTGSFTGGYTGTYSAPYSAPYTGSYSGSFTGPKTYSATYSGPYTGSYTGTFAGTGPYSAAYSSPFTGVYAGPGYATAYAGAYTVYYGGYAAAWYTGYYTSYFSAAYTGYYTGFFTGFYTGPKNYSGTYSGPYTGNYTGFYTGTAAYSGTYSGAYTGYYTGFYTGTYTGYYSGTYSAAYTGVYAGNTVIVTKDTVSTVKLWIRTA